MHRNEMVHKCTLRKFHLPHITMFRAYLIAFSLSLGVTVSNSFARFAYALVLPAMRDGGAGTGALIALAQRDVVYESGKDTRK